MPQLAVSISPYGAVTQVRIRPGPSQVQALQAAGQPVPAETAILGTLDTGAGVTAVDDSVLGGRGMRAANGCQASVPGSYALASGRRYEIDVGLTDDLGNVHWFTLDVCGLPVAHGVSNALLGRDFLSRFEFRYDGRGGQATLQW